MSLDRNINTLDYWNRRFGTGDWEAKGGFSQTHAFAESQVLYLGLPKDFSGTLCDFGCGGGDAFPVYHQAWPQAKLFGVDFAAAAIQLCVARYAQMAKFICGDTSAVPEVDVIICSNVLEHLDDDAGVVEQLLAKCKTLYVIVPYREHPLHNEHIRTYDKNSFSKFTVISKTVFKSRGWTESGLKSLAKIYIENVFRFLMRNPIRHRNAQILFRLTSFETRLE